MTLGVEDEVVRTVAPMYLRAWPKARKRAPLNILCRPGYGIMRRDRRYPLRWIVRIERYARSLPLPLTLEELLNGR